MSLAGSLGLKSLFSLASLVGKDIVAKSLTLTEDIAARAAVFSSTVTATRFFTSLTGDVGVIVGTATTGVGLNTGAGHVQMISSSNVQWYFSGITGGLVSDLSRPVTTAGNGSFGAIIVTGFTDSSGTPGNATANTASGRAAIAAGASSCVISNTLVTANARIFISPKVRDATGLLPIVSAQVAATSFTVSTVGNCTADLTFDWWVVL